MQVIFQCENQKYNIEGITGVGSTLEEIVSSVVSTNYFGTLRVTQAILPLLKNGARVVILSSTVGSRSMLSKGLSEQFGATDLTTVNYYMPIVFNREGPIK